jgi:tetratricopeptide (TPR) repeat protein
MPDYSQMHYNLANLKGQMGKEGEGYHYFGYYYFYEGDFKKAKYNFSKAVSLLPEDNSRKSESKKMIDKITSFEKEM